MNSMDKTDELEKKPPTSLFNPKNQKFWIAGIITVLIVIVGLILIQLGFNEPLYSENPVIFGIFAVITQLGSEYAYIVFFLVLYLAIDKQFSERLIFSFVITLHFTNFFKLTFQDPRPSTNTLESGYGFPSGHTTGSVSFWGYTALHLDQLENRGLRKIMGFFSGFVLIFVPISRLVIGVHDLADIIGGFGLAGFLLILYSYIEPKISSAGWSTSKKISYGVLFGLFLWVLCSVLLAWVHPELLWEQVEELAQSAGLFIGLSIGLPLENRYIGYNPKKLQTGQKFLAGFIGIILGGGLYFGLSALFGLFPDEWNFILRSVKYMLFVIMIVLGLPAFFKRLFAPKTEK